MDIIGLGYVGIDAPDPEAWLAFGRDIIGLDPGCAPIAPAHLDQGRDGRGPDGSVYFRVDEWSWRLAVHPMRDGQERPGLRYLGFEVAGEAELQVAMAELEAAGHAVRRGDAADCQSRAVSGIAFTRDPSGNAVEMFHGPRVTNLYRNSKGMEFLTGDMGMGHVNLFSSNYEESAAFYTGLLGFRMTDFYQVGEGQTVNFFHCNRRHHTVGLMKVAPFDAIHHIMFECTDIDMVGLAYDRVLAAGTKVTASLGRHSNDRIISFYCESPSGVEIEIGWGAITVGPDWTPRFRSPGDLWGHHGLTAEAIAEGGKDK
ncbi:MAG: VOC family protein [Sphingomonadaceae bacterium]|nr:VOC family protein [Sphingomonadaceae bacterium]